MQGLGSCCPTTQASWRFSFYWGSTHFQERFYIRLTYVLLYNKSNNNRFAYASILFQPSWLWHYLNFCSPAGRQLYIEGIIHWWCWNWAWLLFFQAHRICNREKRYHLYLCRMLGVLSSQLLFRLLGLLSQAHYNYGTWYTHLLLWISYRISLSCFKPFV